MCNALNNVLGDGCSVSCIVFLTHFLSRGIYGWKHSTCCYLLHVCFTICGLHVCSQLMNLKLLKEILCIGIVATDNAIHYIPKIMPCGYWKLDKVSYEQYGYSAKWFIRVIHGLKPCVQENNEFGAQHGYFIHNNNFESIPTEGLDDDIDCSCCTQTWHPSFEHAVESVSLWQMTGTNTCWTYAMAHFTPVSKLLKDFAGDIGFPCPSTCMYKNQLLLSCVQYFSENTELGIIQFIL